MSNARCTAAGDSISACSGNRRAPACVERLAGAARTSATRFHLGNHDVAELLAGLAGDGGDVLLERGMVRPDGPGPPRAPSALANASQRHDQRGMLGLAADRRAVLAIERHVEDAGAELLAHLRLQLQALAHPRLDAAVVVAHRQKAARLGAEKDCSRMHGPAAAAAALPLAGIERPWRPCVSCTALSLRAGGRRRPARPAVP